MARVMAVSFTRYGRLYYLDAGEETYTVGEKVLVPTEAGPEVAECVWAPEFVVDPETGEFFVFWSTSFGTAGWDDSRIWCACTRDFETFSEPRVLLDTGYTIIDDLIHGYGGGYLPPVLGSASRPASSWSAW